MTPARGFRVYVLSFLVSCRSLSTTQSYIFNDSSESCGISKCQDGTRLPGHQQAAAASLAALLARQEGAAGISKARCVGLHTSEENGQEQGRLASDGGCYGTKCEKKFTGISLYVANSKKLVGSCNRD